MQELDFISYLKTLKPEDWSKKATDKWTVKDVVAHMVGWEKAVTKIVKSVWETKQEPWFMETDNYDEFNAKMIEYYKNYSPNQLLDE